MALAFPNSGTYLPTALTTITTLVTDATLGVKKFKIDLTNLPAGTILNLSLQVINVSGGSYIEEQNISLANTIAPTAAPSIGYEPVWESEGIVTQYGFQVQAQIISGTLPTTALTWEEASVS